MSMQELFHLPDGPYMLSHSVGCQLKSTQQVLADNYLQPWKEVGGDAWPHWLDSVADFKQQLALLFNVSSSDLCPQTNLSSGFTKFLMSLPKPLGSRNKIVMHQDAFPSMGYVASALQGMSMELILIDDGCPSHSETWRPHLDKDVLCTLVTHVHSNTGSVSPVAEIATLCHDANIHCVVDIAQSAGVLPIDITQWRVDAVFGSCVKWLCGGPGAGFMWVNPNLVDGLNPMDVGWFSHQNPFEMDIQKFAYASGADKFWGGTPSVAPFVVAANSIRTLGEIGIEQIYRYNRRCIQKLLVCGETKLNSNDELARIGGTACIEIAPKHLQTARDNLTNIGAFFDVRGSTLRLSPHIYTSEHQVDEVCDALQRSLK